MSYVMVDIEADGPAPGLYSMVGLGAVLVTPALDQTFYCRLRPISDRWIPEALAGAYTREQTEQFDDPGQVMTRFGDWVAAHGGRRPIFISDNNGFDWSFVNYYFHRFIGRNPFGHSSQNLGSLYKGVVGDTFASVKQLRTTPHTQDPLDGARGNAEALLRIKHDFGVKLALD